MPVNPSEPPRSEDNPWAFAMGAGSELVGAVLAGFFAGQWLDKKLGTGPWLMLVGAICGITLGLYGLIRTSQKRQNSDQKRR